MKPNRRTYHDWRAMAQAGRPDDLDVRPHDKLRVTFPGGRSHVIRVTATDDGFHLEAVVVRDPRQDPGILFKWGSAANRELRLMGVTMSDGGKLAATSWIPAAGLTATEFQFHVRHFAAECDRLEFALTGEDRQ